MILTTSRRAATARPGFTMVELLMVTLIVTILLSITVVGLQKATDSQKNRTSKEQVYKLQQSLDSEYNRVVDACRSDQTNKKIPQPVVDYCEGDINRALAVWMAMKLRQQFPQSFAEAVTPFTAIPGYSLSPHQAFTVVSGATSNGQANEESGALLYLILATKTASGGGAMASSADDLGQQRKVTFGSVPLNTFVDAFGRSVGFNRWEASALVQQPPFVDLKNSNKDPLDPRNLVFGWANTTKQPQMQTLLGFNNQNRTANVYSLGKDLTDPTDDIVGCTLRSFGK
jgi:prepilin-type N-terminal cleavage/methylation domain-containing protein